MIASIDLQECVRNINTLEKLLDTFFAYIKETNKTVIASMEFLKGNILRGPRTFFSIVRIIWLHMVGLLSVFVCCSEQIPTYSPGWGWGVGVYFDWCIMVIVKMVLVVTAMTSFIFMMFK